MSATNSHDKERLKLEDIIAHLVSVDDCLDKVQTRLCQNAVTEDDAMTLFEIMAARAEVRSAKKRLAGFHPNRLEGDHV